MKKNFEFSFVYSLDCFIDCSDEVHMKNNSLSVCLCQGQTPKNFSLNIEYFKSSSKIGNLQHFGLWRTRSKKHFPYRDHRRFSCPVVIVHQHKLDVFEREESESVVSFSKR